MWTFDSKLGGKDSGEGWSTKKKVGIGILGFFIFLLILGGILVLFQDPNFVVTDLEVTPSQTGIDEQVTISANVRNTGDASGTYEANLKINGKVVNREAVSLDSGENQKIKFEVTEETEGEYNVELGGVTDNFNVQKQAKLVVKDLKVEPQTVGPEEPATVTVTVKNEGQLEGSKEYDLRVDGSIIDSKEITLEPGKSDEINFEVTRSSEGTYNLSLSGLSESFEVKKPFLQVLDAKWDDWNNVYSCSSRAPPSVVSDPKVFTVKVRLYNNKANDVLGGNESIQLSYLKFSSEEGGLRTETGGTYEAYSLCNAPDKIQADGEAVFWVIFDEVPRNAQFTEIVYDAPGEKAISAEIYSQKESEPESSEFTLESELNQASGEIEAIDFSPNNEYIAYGSKDSKVYVHSTEDWSLLSSFGELSVKVRNLKFSPNNQFLAFTYEDKSNLYVYSTSTWEKVATLSKSGGEVKRFNFSPNGEYIAYSSKDTNVYIHSTDDWSDTATLSQSNSPVHPVKFSPDGNYIAYGVLNGHVHVHSTDTWNELIDLASGDWVRMIDFSPDSERMASAGNSGNIQIFSTGTWEKIETLSTGMKARHVAFSPDGQMVGYGANGTAYVNSTSDWSLEKQFTDQKPHVFTTVFSPDSRYFVYDSSGTGKVFVYSIEDWTEKEAFDSSRGRFSFSSEGSLFAVQNGRTIRVYEVG